MATCQQPSKLTYLTCGLQVDTSHMHDIDYVHMSHTCPAQGNSYFCSAGYITVLLHKFLCSHLYSYQKHPLQQLFCL